MAGRLKLGLVVLAVVLLVYANDQRMLGANYEDEPRVVTPKELVESDPGDNRHIELVKFRLDLDEVVYRYIEKDGKEEWKTVYIPIRGRRKSDQLKILVTSDKIRGEQDVIHFAKRDKLEGMIVTGVDSLKTDVQDLLHQGFPGTDFDTVWILDVDKKKPFTWWIPGLFAVFLLGGVVMSFRQ